MSTRACRCDHLVLLLVGCELTRSRMKLARSLILVHWVSTYQGRIHPVIKEGRRQIDQSLVYILSDMVYDIAI